MTASGIMAARLAAISAVTALVSSRIYALVLKQGGTYPAIRLQQIGRETPMQLRGTSGLVQAIVQVDCVSETGLAAAETLLAAVRGDCASGAPSGVVGFKGTVGGVVVHGMLPAGDEQHIFDPDDLRQVKATQDFHLIYRSAA